MLMSHMGLRTKGEPVKIQDKLNCESYLLASGLCWFVFPINVMFFHANL